MNAPRLISRYEVKGLIARGGMGDLHLARDPNTNRLVVVKLLSATLESSDIRERFEREARSLASLSHPNIVQIYDYGELDDTPFIVIEYVRGETLGERIKRRAPMSLALKLKLLAELCGGLAHAHGAGIIHRDVKPGNLMVDQDDRLKILDFGIARVADSSLTRFGVLASQLVMQIGTPGYMSPEQVQGAEIDARSDVFAAGAVCYALLAYRDPFTGKNPDEIERSVMIGSPVPLTSLVPDLDPDVVSIVTRALAKSREQRYPDAATMGAALERCRQRLAETVSPPAAQVKAGSPAETAYQRALALYEQGSREAARRFSVEALAEDPNHAAARALLTRVQAERRAANASPRQPTQAASVPATAAAASRTPTTDDPTAPTVHIPAVQRPDTAAELEPTILMKPGQRPGPPAAAAPTIVSPRTGQSPPSPDTRTTVRANTPARPSADPFAVSGRGPEKARAVPIDPDALFGPADRSAAQGAEETVLISPRSASREVPPKPTTPRAPEKSRTPGLVNKRPQPPATGAWAKLTSAVTSWKSRVSPPPKRPSQGRERADQTLWKHYGLSVGIAAALLILIGGIALVAVWVFTPSGHLLTISRPVNGTIAGHGLRCGTAGADCSVTVKEGELVELSQEPDAGYAFGGYTPDCAPVGRFAMSGPRTCSATFELLPPPAVPPKTWTLTLIRPTNGTLMAAGKECGEMRSDCSVEVPDGVPVTVYATANPNYVRSSFFGDCAPGGQMQMTGPLSCGATFVPRSPVGGRPPKPPEDVVSRGRPPVDPGPRPPPPPPPEPPKEQNPGPIEVGGKVDPARSENEHAKTIEIPILLKQYCAALESLDPRKVQQVYQAADLNSYRRMFNPYKSLKCAMAEPKYLQLDGKAGTAELEVGLKQTIEYGRGGAPAAFEFIVTMSLSRPEERTTWRIVKLVSVLKPKP